MGIGAAVRRAAGPLEPALAGAYRSMFFDVPDFAARLASLDQAGSIGHVIEVGCGEGALVSELVQRLPQAEFTGVDTAATVGRLFQGRLQQPKFLQATAQDLLPSMAFAADLVVLCDVLHHVPADERRSLLTAAAILVRPGGHLVVKEWVRLPTPAYWAGWASDRFVTGDQVNYGTRAQWMAEIASAAPHLELQDEWELRPWACNHAFVLRLPS